MSVKSILKKRLTLTRTTAKIHPPTRVAWIDQWRSNIYKLLALFRMISLLAERDINCLQQNSLYETILDIFKQTSKNSRQIYQKSNKNLPKESGNRSTML